MCVAEVGGTRSSCLPQREPPQWVGEAVDSPGSVPPLDAGSIHLPEIFSSPLQSSTAPLTAAPLLCRIYLLCLVRLICAPSPSLSLSLFLLLSLSFHFIWSTSAHKNKNKSPNTRVKYQIGWVHIEGWHFKRGPFCPSVLCSYCISSESRCGLMCLSLSLSLCLSLHEVYFGALFKSEDRQPPLLVELLSALFISAAVLVNGHPHRVCTFLIWVLQYWVTYYKYM